MGGFHCGYEWEKRGGRMGGALMTYDKKHISFHLPHGEPEGFLQRGAAAALLCEGVGQL